MITVVLTLLQNKKMIENATRPYVAVSCETICSGPNKSHRYIVVKNYGQSSAVIKKADCVGIKDDLFLRQFSHIIDSTLAPMQRRMYYLRGSAASHENKRAVFTITYVGSSKEYSESSALQLDSGSLTYRSTGESYALQEIAERLI